MWCSIVLLCIVQKIIVVEGREEGGEEGEQLWEMCEMKA